MSKTVDYYYAPISPFAYLGSVRFREICEQHGATICHKPVDLGRVFPVSGGLPLAKRPVQRQAYRLIELKRWSDFLGMPLNLQPQHFPVSADSASRLILAADAAGHNPTPLAEALMAAVWSHDENISDPATLTRLADAAGLPGDSLMAAAAGADIEARYTSLTEEAISLGIFGAPTYVYRGEMFWGQDRLDFLARALVEA